MSPRLRRIKAKFWNGIGSEDKPLRFMTCSLTIRHVLRNREDQRLRRQKKDTAKSVSRRSICLWPAFLISTILMSIPLRIFAFEREFQLGVDPSCVFDVSGEEKSQGFGVLIDSSLTLGDVFAVIGVIGWTGLWRGDVQEYSTLDHEIYLAIGARYAIDILNPQPYLGVLLGTFVAFFDEKIASFCMSALGGIDWSFHENFSLGIVVNFSYILDGFSSFSRMLLSVRINWQTGQV